MSRKLAAEFLSLLWMVILILFLRWAVIEPFKIPSGSMIPTLLVGDFIFVSKSSYDLRIPFTNTPILRIADPKRGDVIVFEYPNHERDPVKEGQYYIKRLIGLPGDRISIRRGYPLVNLTASQVEAVRDDEKIAGLDGFRFNSNNLLFQEKLPGTSSGHWVQRYPYRGGGGNDLEDGSDPPCGRVGPHDPEENVGAFRASQINEICVYIVPKGHYFFMGDNRDDSADSRQWGFVDRNLLKGRALFVWFTCESFDSGSLSRDVGQCFSSIRWSRLGKGIR